METLLTLCIATLTVLGVFGKDTTHNCDSKHGTISCSGYMWDSLQKQCIQCKEGYTGIYCQIACPFPSYGLNCQSICNFADEDGTMPPAVDIMLEVLDVTTDDSSRYNKSVYDAPNIIAKRKPSINNPSFLFSLIVVIAVLIVIFVIFLYT